jgi:hypothetical protein
MTNDLATSQLNLLLINVRLMNSNVVVLRHQVEEYQATIHWWAAAGVVWTIVGVIALVIISQRLKAPRPYK